MPNLLCFFGIYCRKITLPLYRTITSSTARCSVGLYSSQNLLFSVKNLTYFPQSVIVWVVMVRRVVVVFKMKESKNVEKAIVCHYVRIKWSAVLLLSGPVIFEALMWVIPHLNHKPKKCVHFFNGNIRWLC